MLTDDFCQRLNSIFEREVLDTRYISAILKCLNENDLVEWISLDRECVLARKVWFLYEKFVKYLPALESIRNNTLPYVKILDDTRQFTLELESNNHERQKIINNMINHGDLYVTIARTHEFLNCTHEMARVCNMIENFPVNQAFGQYMFEREIEASYKIENEKAHNLSLQILSEFDFSREKLVDLQNRIVNNPKDRLSDWRDFQTYVGGTRQLIGYAFTEEYNYICPKPEDVPSLMNDLIQLAAKISMCDPILLSTILSFTFVFVHPFGDGNGRISRFLINWAMSRKVPFTLPISMVIANNKAWKQEYYRILHSFSDLVYPHIEYTVSDDNGVVHVTNQTKHLYQHFTLTEYVEYVSRLLNKAAEHFSNEYKIFYCTNRMEKKYQADETKLKLALHLLITNKRLGVKKIKKLFKNEASYKEFVNIFAEICCEFIS